MEPPWEQVQSEKKAMVEKVIWDGPYNPGVFAEIEKFREDRKKPKN